MTFFLLKEAVIRGWVSGVEGGVRGRLLGRVGECAVLPGLGLEDGRTGKWPLRLAVLVHESFETGVPDPVEEDVGVIDGVDVWITRPRPQRSGYRLDLLA